MLCRSDMRSRRFSNAVLGAGLTCLLALSAAIGVEKERFPDDDFEQEEAYADAIGMLNEESKESQKQGRA